NEALETHDLTQAGTHYDLLQDVNNDGFLDLLLHFPAAGTGITEGDTKADLTGYFLPSFGGFRILGSDAIYVVDSAPEPPTATLLLFVVVAFPVRGRRAPVVDND